MTTPRHDIDYALAMRLLREAYALGLREVGFSKSGEPFMNPLLNEYIRAAKDIGYQYIYLATNGSLASPERIIGAVESGMDSIKFSINGISPEPYRFIHGADGFASVYEHLKFTWRYRKESGKNFRIFVSYVETRYTQEQREDIYQCFRPYCDEVLIVAARNQGGYDPAVDDLLRPAASDVDFNEHFQIPCRQPFCSLTVTCDGYLQACCLECQNFLAVEDLRNMSLEQAWNSERFRAFRRRHIEGNVAGLACENCVRDANIKPIALNPELASDFNPDNMFRDGSVAQRIEDYRRILEQNAAPGEAR